MSRHGSTEVGAFTQLPSLGVYAESGSWPIICWFDAAMIISGCSIGSFHFDITKVAGCWDQDAVLAVRGSDTDTVEVAVFPEEGVEADATTVGVELFPDDGVGAVHGDLFMMVLLSNNIFIFVCVFGR